MELSQITSTIELKQFDQYTIEHLCQLDDFNQQSIVSQLFQQVDSYHEAVRLLKLVKVRISLACFKRLIHFDSSVDRIPFHMHPVIACYNKYGINSYKSLITEFYDDNTDFNIKLISGDKTIIHMEHYKDHKSSMSIIEYLKNLSTEDKNKK